MSEHDPHSLVLALDYRVDDIEHRWSAINERAAGLAGIGAHHVVLYISVSEPGRVLVTIGIRHRNSVEDVLRSPALFEWFDQDGVNDIPAVFGGEALTKIDLAVGDDRGAVIVGAVSTVGDVPGLVADVHRRVERLAGAGVRRLRMYRAFDDPQEVMTLLEFDGPASAQHWIDQADSTAGWMSGTGSTAHPSLFTGRLAGVVTFDT